ncbi:MAG: hypothetical protein QM756_22610 [Polyangiaceae bacterium]
MYRRLDPERVTATAVQLHQRIEERFPGSGLSRVALELEQVTREAHSLAAFVGHSHPGVLWGVRACVALLLLVPVAVASQMKFDGDAPGWADLLQGVEALVNDIVFVGVAIYFLLGFDARRKRKHVLQALHTLRSLSHIVDMHQLTKDPERLVAPGPRTPSSPERTMSAFELTRYLDYSSEMLAIAGKVAAIYVQEFDDPVTLDAASSVQELTVNLSRSIWQKIVILERSVPSTASTNDA